jgi:OmpA-OmpF porin, OOP family
MPNVLPTLAALSLGLAAVSWQAHAQPTEGYAPRIIEMAQFQTLGSPVSDDENEVEIPPVTTQLKRNSPGVTIIPVEAIPAEVESIEDAAEVAPYRFSVTKAGNGDLTFRGHVPREATIRLLENLVDDPAALDGLTVSDAAPEAFSAAMAAGLAALSELQTGQLAYANGRWLISGYAEIDTRRSAIENRIAARPETENWHIMVTAPSARSVCEAEVDAYMDSRVILFGSGNAIPTADSLAMLPGIAERLSLCPDETIYVEGHTDSDGSAELNLSLSVARAEAVVDELIGLVVAASRLYAVGYGASLPIASNETAEGKRQNRRIVFNLDDPAVELDETNGVNDVP